MTDEEIIIQLSDKFNLLNQIYNAKYELAHTGCEPYCYCYVNNVFGEVEKYLTKELKAEIRKAAKQFND